MCRLIPLTVIMLILVVSAWMTGHFDNELQADAEIEALPLAPDFTWRSFDGKSHKLRELDGHPVVLHFWASWCAACRTEFPKLLAAAAKRPNNDIIFLTISSDEDRTKALQFIHKAEVIAKTKPPVHDVFSALDSKQSIAFDVFQTVQYPETIFLDSGHHLRRKVAGTVDWSSGTVRNYLNGLK